MKSLETPAKRNPMAGVLAHGLFRNKAVKAAKGKGSYKRKPKHNKIYC